MAFDGQHFDIIIIGGGLAGNCLGLALEGSGLNIAIVEANTKNELTSSTLADRALALAAGTITTLEKFGLWEAIKEKATAIKEIHVSDRGHFGKVRMSAQKQGVDALGYVITAREIESYLSDTIDNTKITKICPARLVGLMSGTDEINVSLKYQNKSICITGKLLIGADGGNSSVRKLLDIEQEITEYGQTALVTTVKTALPHHHVAYERFTESGPLAVLPCAKNHCSIVWTQRNQDVDGLITADPRDFMHALQQCFGYRLGKLTITEPVRAFPVALIRAKKMRSGRALIIGNAVHQLHPVAGQGFNLGLRDVAQLAEMLHNQHGLGKDLGAPEFISAYVLAREKDHRLTIGFTDSLVRLFSNEWLAVAAARNMGLALLDHIPIAKSLLSKHAMGLAQGVVRLTGHSSQDHAK